MIELSSVAYSPDGKLLAIGGQGGVTIYNASTRLPYQGLASNAGSVSSIAFSPDGTTLAVAVANGPSSGLLELWNIGSGKLVSTFSTSATSLYSVAFSPNGMALADGGVTTNSVTKKSVGVLEEWSLITQKRVRSFGTAATTVYSVAFSPDSKALADGGANGTKGALELWAVGTGALTKTFLTTQTSSIVSVAFTPDGKRLASGGSGSSGGLLQEWAVAPGSLNPTLTLGTPNISSMALSPDGNSAAVVGTVYTNSYGQAIGSGILNIWSLSGSPTLTRYNTTGWNLNSVAFSPDSSTIAEVGTNYSWFGTWLGGAYEPSGGFFEIWNVSEATLEASATTTQLASGLPSNPSSGAPAFSPDGTLVVGGGLDFVYQTTASPNGFINIWDTATGTLVTAIPTDATVASFTAAFSPDNQFLAISGSGDLAGYLEIWNISTGVLVSRTVTGISGGVLTFSPNGQLLAIEEDGSGYHTSIEVLSVSTGQVVETLASTANSAVCLAFSPDGSSLADGGSYLSNDKNALPKGVLELWNVSSGQLIADLGTKQAFVFGIAFSPDGKTLAAGGYSETSKSSGIAGTMELWGVSTQNLLSSASVPPGTSELTKVWYSVDGNSLYATANAAVQEIQAYNPSNSKLLGYLECGWFYYFSVSPKAGAIAFTNPWGGLAVSTIPPITSVQIESISLNPGTVQSGGTSTGTVTLTQPAPAGGITVGLQATPGPDGSQDVSVPVTVTIPAGMKSATFSVTTGGVSSPTTEVITASSGPNIATATLTILALKVVSVDLSSPIFVGGGSLTGTININAPAGLTPFPVSVSSSSPLADVPATVSIYEGQTNNTFTISTSPVTTKQVVTITVRGGTTTMSVFLTLTPPLPQSIVLSPSSLAGGSSSTATVNLTGPAGVGGVVVKLSSGSAFAKVPPSVTIPAGSTSATFAITTSSVSGRTAATITATASGTAVTAELVIT